MLNGRITQHVLIWKSIRREYMLSNLLFVIVTHPILSMLHSMVRVGIWWDVAPIKKSLYNACINNCSLHVFGYHENIVKTMEVWEPFEVAQKFENSCIGSHKLARFMQDFKWWYQVWSQWFHISYPCQGGIWKANNLMWFMLWKRRENGALLGDKGL